MSSSGELLALGTAGVFALLGASRRGSRSSEGCEGPYFHTTTWSRLQSIADSGLHPGWSSRFGGYYGAWSRDKVFVARGYDEAGQWFQRVSSAVENTVGMQVREQEDLELVVPVMLRVDLRGLVVRQDTVGGRDTPCSFYVTERVEPERIWFYDGSSERWRPIAEWDRSDPMVSVQSWEQEWEEEGPEDAWISFHLREPWDDEPGAFAPPYMDEDAANEGWGEQLGEGSGHRNWDPVQHLGPERERELRAELASKRPGFHVDAFGSLQPGIPWGAGRLGAVTLSVSPRRVYIEHGTLADERVYYALTVLAALDPRVRDAEVSVDNTPPLTVGWVVDEPYRDPEKRLPRLYHGTSTALLNRILAQGLRPRRQSGMRAAYGVQTAGASLEDRVYLTTFDAMGPALFASSAAARKHGGERVVLQVDPRKLRRELLVPDEDSQAADWVGSIKRIGAVAYRGAVPPEALSVYAYPRGRATPFQEARKHPRG